MILFIIYTVGALLSLLLLWLLRSFKEDERNVETPKLNIGYLLYGAFSWLSVLFIIYVLIDNNDAKNFYQYISKTDEPKK